MYPSKAVATAADTGTLSVHNSSLITRFWWIHQRLPLTFTFYAQQYLIPFITFAGIYGITIKLLFLLLCQSRHNRQELHMVELQESTCW